MQSTKCAKVHYLLNWKNGTNLRAIRSVGLRKWLHELHYVSMFSMGLCVGSSLLSPTYAATTPAGMADGMAAEFVTPPSETRPWVYWQLPYGNITKKGLTRDLEEMRNGGIGGAVYLDIHNYGRPVEHPTPKFMSEEYRDLFRHTLKEAERCGITLTVNMCSGYNCGGPWVTEEHAAKKLLSVCEIVMGPGRVTLDLPKPKNELGLEECFTTKEWRLNSPAGKIICVPNYKTRQKDWLAYYRDIAVLAIPVSQQIEKSVSPRLWPLDQAVDISSALDAHGQLTWEAPAGKWQILRIGYGLGCWATTSPGSGPAGLEIDPMSAEAMDLHFAETGAKMVADAGPLVGKTLHSLQIESWEIGSQPTWTPKMQDEFQKRCGYALTPYLPAILGWTVTDDATTERFRRDYCRVVADLMTENYYGRLDYLARKNGLQGAAMQAGGPYYYHWVDALQALGTSTFPVGEFWKRPPALSKVTTIGTTSMKQTSSATHIYSQKQVFAEALTSMGCFNFHEGPWNQRIVIDNAFCDGAQNNFINLWITQANPETRPGWVNDGICPDFNYKQSWWPLVDGWTRYIARCQYMFGKGSFVADFALLRNEKIPDFPAVENTLFGAHIMKQTGYDYDWINGDVLRRRISAKNGRLVLPDGMSYQYLLVPNGYLADGTLKKINDLAMEGIAVIADKPRQGLCAKVRIGDWRKLTIQDGTKPDVTGALKWIHRRVGEADIYFIAEASAPSVTFRVTGKQPELWDAVSGEIRNLLEFTMNPDGTTTVPLRFAPDQSFFVLFRKALVVDATAKTGKNFPEVNPLLELTGPWDVQFDQNWFYPDEGTGGKLRFDKLEDWTKRPEAAVKHYSGIAVYRKTFDFSANGSSLFIDVGSVEKMARVRLNGKDLGTIWCAPWRIAVPSGLLKDKGNELEIQVANLWSNRLLADQSLPQEQRRTKTNQRNFVKNNPQELLPSGLIGPVRIMVAEQ